MENLSLAALAQQMREEVSKHGSEREQPRAPKSYQDGEQVNMGELSPKKLSSLALQWPLGYSKSLILSNEGSLAEKSNSGSARAPHDPREAIVASAADRVSLVDEGKMVVGSRRITKAVKESCPPIRSISLHHKKARLAT
eukprot:CAMPEP_0185595544 /NCGR_PEP_ID=MMETSP0434-20130131/78810_1 /TAXON_ID=626734 ORGANISM="Favella taraikaensis, Strain Fe Narragansett Bay" /NCGR_SAMPLE_ID=MMETSP0434 /ASSEMBLY_ACC=CAM_ASM_000379 /LENGTH=139 /DNA_ID=CAMNT_0028223629 /DNA_START=170 /DNA_END=590 /DNA_ORIENTATION=+